MSLNFLQVLNPIFGLIVNILAQIIIFKFSPNPKLLRSLLLGFMIGLTVLFILEIYIFLMRPIIVWHSWIIFITNLITYSAFGYCYFHFVNLGETARRVRILRELFDSKDGLSKEEILERYNAKVILERRINRLISNNQIILRDGSYYLGKPVMFWIAKVLVNMKLIIMNKKLCE